MSDETPTNFDVIVIGAGPAGEVAAGGLAAQGAVWPWSRPSSSAGSARSTRACRRRRSFAQVRCWLRRGEYQGRRSDHRVVDVAAALARRDEVIHGLEDSAQLGWLEQRGITLIRGHGRLDGERCVRVGEQRYAARDAVVVAVGSARRDPADPRACGRATVDQSRGDDSARDPAGLIVLGGGAVGVEMAQAYTELGARVTARRGARAAGGQRGAIGQRRARGGVSRTGHRHPARGARRSDPPQRGQGARRVERRRSRGGAGDPRGGRAPAADRRPRARDRRSHARRVNRGR